MTVSATELQTLVDQATIRSAVASDEQMQQMDSAIERWADTNRRQVEAINRLIEQNRILQRRAAAAPNEPAN